MDNRHCNLIEDFFLRSLLTKNSGKVEDMTLLGVVDQPLTTILRLYKLQRPLLGVDIVINLCGGVSRVWLNSCKCLDL